VSRESRIHHVGLAVPSIARFVESQRALYGDFERSELIVNERQGVRELFLRRDGIAIELLEPLHAKSPIQGFLDRNRRGGLVHVALEVKDLDGTIRRVEENRGKLIVGPVPDVAFEGRRIAFVFLDGQVTELIEAPR
jgi:methylmalonyl-CoA/ethylmalonyl-CoA epimerase